MRWELVIRSPNPHLLTPSPLPDKTLAKQPRGFGHLLWRIDIQKRVASRVVAPDLLRLDVGDAHGPKERRDLAPAALERCAHRLEASLGVDRMQWLDVLCIAGRAGLERTRHQDVVVARFRQHGAEQR